MRLLFSVKVKKEKLTSQVKKKKTVQVERKEGAFSERNWEAMQRPAGGEASGNGAGGPAGT